MLEASGPLLSASPADLSVEQPTRLHVMLNLRAAHSLDLTVSPLHHAYVEEVD
jgi:hypothetical protein